MSQAQLEVRSEARNALLEIRNLNVIFTKTQGTILKTETRIQAVNDLSLSVRKGEVFSIVGESGSGKTTLARCVVGFVDSTSGSIMYDGKSIESMRRKDVTSFRRSVQMIYQDPYESLNPRHDILTTISVPLRFLCGEKEKSRIVEKSRRLLEEVGLNPSDVLYRYPHELSGGERQRVSIARALAPDPQLLIADEPVTMVDAAQRLKILRILEDLRTRRSLTLLMITHDLASAKIISDRIGIMYRGNLVELGSADEVLTHPHHPYVELIRESMPDLRDTSLKELDLRSVAEAQENETGCLFRARCKYATEICATTAPKLLEKSPNHFAACHNPLK